MLCLAVPCFAQGPGNRTVRVGWYIYEQLQEYDENGDPIGYSQSCLETLSRYTGFNYEYVNGTFEECYKKLCDGDIDMLLFVQYSPERGKQVNFCDYPLGHSNTNLTCLAENAQYYAGIESLNGKAVALEKGAYQEKELLDFIRGKDIEVNIVHCDTTMQAKDVVDNGLADFAFLPSIVPISEKQVVLESLYMHFLNVAVDKNNIELLQELERGIGAVLENDPLFFKRLNKIYFDSAAAEDVVLNPQEKAALEELGTMRVYMNNNNGYLSRLEDGEIRGIRADLVKHIAQKLDIGYELVQETNAERVLRWQSYDDFDFVSGMYFDYSLAKKRGLQITLPYLSHKYYCIRNKDYTGTQEDAVIAALGYGNYFTDNYIVPNYQNNRFIFPGDIVKCLDAVNSGEADITFSTSYNAEYYMLDYKYSNLTTSITDYTSQSCFGTRVDMNPHVISAINKAIESISPTEMDNIILRNTVANKNNFTVAGTIRRNPLGFSAMLFALVGTMFLAFMSLLYTRKLKSKNQELALATESKERFFSQLSHDIRTPMNGILGSVMLAKGTRDVEKLEEAISDIEKSGEFMLTLLNDVLDMSKIRDDNFSLKVEPYDYIEFENSIKAIILPKAAEKSICLTIKNTTGQKGYVLLDKIRTQQIFINLLSNAIKFTPIGGDVEMIIAPQTLDNNSLCLHFEVRDNGMGMSDDFVKNRLFYEFEQEKPSTSGTGLGLSIVKKLVDKMGGTIRCESQEGKGSTFVVDIPAIAVKGHAKKAEKNIPAKQTMLLGKRVLLCEDNQLNAKVAIKFLEKFGIETDVAENGKIGSEKFFNSENGCYDAILMDVRMPVMDGLTATKAIRANGHPQSKTIPIIAMSANALNEDIEASCEAGMNAHLSKPIDPQLLYRTLAEQIAKSSNCGVETL